MASPTLESYCCWLSSNKSYNSSIDDGLSLSQTVVSLYNSFCIVSSCLSVGGAVFQLWPRTPRQLPRGHREVEALVRQNTIICWLAFADLLASLGIRTLDISVSLLGLGFAACVKSWLELPFQIFFIYRRQ